MESACAAQHIDHIGIAVHDLDAAMKLFHELFSVPMGEPQDLADQGVKAVLLSVGQTRLELLEPLQPESSVGRFLKTRGEGLHHLAFNVPNITRSLSDLREKAVRLVDEKPREGLSGMIAFIHPRSVHGVLTELVQTIPE